MRPPPAGQSWAPRCAKQSPHRTPLFLTLLPQEEADPRDLEPYRPRRQTSSCLDASFRLSRFLHCVLRSPTTGQLRIRATRWKDREDTPKGGRERIVPLSRDALSALKAHRHLRTYVFDHKDGRPFSHSEVKSVVPRACRAAGLGKRLTTHGLRHTFASHLVMRGTALLVVKELLGHADLSMVLRYAHLAPNITREAIQVLDLPAQSHADRTPTDREQKEKAPKLPGLRGAGKGI